MLVWRAIWTCLTAFFLGIVFPCGGLFFRTACAWISRQTVGEVV